MTAVIDPHLTLTKHHGLGNDFLVVFDPRVADLPALARELCDRRRGMGADGLLVGEGAEGANARMTLYNSDGTRAEMSGNGIRCFAQALSSRTGAVGQMCILTDAGPRHVTVSAGDTSDVIHAEVDMGMITTLDEPSGWAEVGCDLLRPVSHLHIGNPHTVVGVEEVDVVDLASIATAIPDVNLEIIEPGPEHHAITMRVHERGAGVTEACGTGACVAAWAAAAWGLVPSTAREVVVHMDGVDATVRLHHPLPDHVTLIGPSVFVGTITVQHPEAA